MPNREYPDVLHAVVVLLRPASLSKDAHSVSKSLTTVAQNSNSLWLIDFFCG